TGDQALTKREPITCLASDIGLFQLISSIARGSSFCQRSPFFMFFRGLFCFSDILLIASAVAVNCGDSFVSGDQAKLCVLGLDAFVRQQRVPLALAT
ncbi:MAG: hypothetical protein M3H12_01265, partial [Chromatiales bacterium]